jgi:hypothetical protein
MAKSTLNSDILAAALIGFEVQKTQIDTKIAELRSLMDGGSTAPTAPSDSGKSKRKVSAAARRRMAKAQKLRWKKIKQAEGPAEAEPAKPKRVLSASARRAISAAQKARWAAKKASAARPAAPKKAARKKAAKSVAKKRQAKTAGAPEQAAAAGA